MIFMVISFIISLFLEITLPNLFVLFIPFFCLASLTLYNNKYRYIIMLGIIYDFLFTKSIILHAFIFLFINFFTRKLVKNNIITNTIVYLLAITIYLTIMIFYKYIYYKCNIYDIFLIVKNSFIINIIYFIILNIIFVFNSNRKRKLSYF